jgi:tetratricopeptide (TPR) repeat protein
MAYPGDPALDAGMQQRVLKAFSEAVRLYHEGHTEEALTILRSVGDVDPKFVPAQQLEKSITTGQPVDLSQWAQQFAGPSGAGDFDAMLQKARQALAQGDFGGALVLAQSVLREMPGHPQARQLALDAQTRMRSGGDVSTHIANAREALSAGLIEEARSFLRLARSINPKHPDVAALESRIQQAGGAAAEAEQEFEFEVFEPAPEDKIVKKSATVPTVPLAPPPAPAPPRVAPAPAAQPFPATPAAAVAPAAASAPSFGAPAGGAAAPFAAPPSAPAAPFAAPPSPPRPAATLPPRPAAPPTAPGPAPAPTFAAPGGGAASPFVTAASEDLSLFTEDDGSHEDAEVRIKALLDQGQVAFERQDFQGAIDTWSRIYLIDPRYPEAERRIEQARLKRDELARMAEHRYYEAREAFEQGRLDDARSLCQQVLQLQPQHLEAHDLLSRLETPAAPPPAAAAAPAGEEDLFRDDFVPARAATAAAPEAAPTPASAPAAAAAPARTAPPLADTLSAIPWKWLAVAAAVVAISVLSWTQRGRIFSSTSGQVADALVQADKLVREERLQDALNLLKSVQVMAEGEQGNRLNQKVLEVQHALKVRAAASTRSVAVPAREAFASGRPVKALLLARSAQVKSPGNPELMALQNEIAAAAPGVPRLVDALQARNWDVGRQAATQLKEDRPGDAEAQKAWVVTSFNYSVTLLRKYQVVAAHDVLDELAHATDDPEVMRLRDLAKSYLAKPSDPRYQIFVTNIELRSLD